MELLDYCIQPRGGTVGWSIMGSAAEVAEAADGSVGGSECSWFQRSERGTVTRLQQAVRMAERGDQSWTPSAPGPPATLDPPKMERLNTGAVARGYGQTQVTPSGNQAEAGFCQRDRSVLTMRRQSRSLERSNEGRAEV